MLQRKFQRSSANPSKRLSRRIRSLFDWVKFSGKNFFPLFLLLLFLFLCYNLFVIRKVNCSLNSQPCPEEIERKTSALIGSNALLINQKDLLASIKKVYPVEKSQIGFKIFNTLQVDLTGDKKYFNVDTFLVKDLPTISMDLSDGSTESGYWRLPTIDLDTYIATQEAFGFTLWEDGNLSPAATTEGKIIYIFSEKHDQEDIKGIFNLFKLTEKYLNLEKMYIVNHRCFLRQSGQPDIIVYVPFDEGLLETALQSLSYLVTIKKDARVIDLSFKNPIIR